MALSMWKGRSNKTHNFIDKQVKKQFDIGGVDIFVRLYLYPDMGVDVEEPDELDESVIQDSLLGENRDRIYSDEYYIIKGSYDEIDNEYELIAAGLAIADGTIIVTLPMNDSVDRLGRKLMSGDVLEFSNMRDDLLLDEDAPAINRLYMVKDVTIQGYSQSWYPHLLRCVAKPILDSREVSDILDDDMDIEEEMGGDGSNTGGSGSDNSVLDKLFDMDEANYQYALQDVDKRGKEAGHLHFDHPESEPWIFAADGIPQNMWKPENVDNGIQFPNDSQEGDWFLRIDYKPHRLFYRKDGKWLFVERKINDREWRPASVVQETFINNDNETEMTNGEIVPSKQKLQNVVKPRADD